MLKLSRKVEYGILSMQMMAISPGKVYTTKELSEIIGLSYEFLAKTLQQLMKHGLIKSIQGVKGGYELAGKPDNINLMQIIDALESKPALVQCCSDDSNKTCEIKDRCLLHDPIKIIQEQIDKLFVNTKLSDISQQNIIPIEEILKEA